MYINFLIRGCTSDKNIFNCCSRFSSLDFVSFDHN